MALLSLQMNNSDDMFKRSLHDLVSSADNIQQLVSILQTLSLNNLKQYIHQQIDTLASCKYSYFNGCNIDHIFGEDLMQHILSFAGVYNTKVISKTWKSYSDKNEALQISKMHQYLNNKTPSEFKYDAQKNKTWIIHPHRKTLHSKEKELNYNEPISDVNKAISRCKSGDRILIYNGSYILNSGACAVCEVEKDIILVGVENNVTIKEAFGGVDIFLYGSMYVENITFDSVGIMNEPNAKGDTLWMNNVTMKGCCVGLYQNNNDVFVSDCTFDGTHIEICTSSQNTMIQRCKFRNNKNKNGCIKLNKSSSIKVTCIGNTFTNINGYPIYVRAFRNKHNVLEEHQYEFKGNVLESVIEQDVSIGVNNIDIDPNKLHIV